MKAKRISTVKIDSDLLSEIGDFINSGNNKFKYVNKKQFVDIAVLEKLKKEGFDGRKKKH